MFIPICSNTSPEWRLGCHSPPGLWRCPGWSSPSCSPRPAAAARPPTRPTWSEKSWKINLPMSILYCSMDRFAFIRLQFWWYLLFWNVDMYSYYLKRPAYDQIRFSYSNLEFLMISTNMECLGSLDLFDSPTHHFKKKCRKKGVVWNILIWAPNMSIHCFCYFFQTPHIKVK